MASICLGLIELTVIVQCTDLLSKVVHKHGSQCSGSFCEQSISRYVKADKNDYMIMFLEKSPCNIITITKSQNILAMSVSNLSAVKVDIAKP